MNRVDFLQTGGFPLETDTLNFLQDSFNLMQNFSAIVGKDNCILSGCELNNGSVNNGFVVLNGELLPFIGGILQTNIVIREDNQSRPFENGQIKKVFYTRYSTFGNGTGEIPFNSLLRFKTLSAFRNLPQHTSSALL
ncbi:hypothetical protein [Pedobacter sp. NJ-S-72]